MLRFKFLMAFIAMIYLINPSETTDCASTTFQQEVSAVKLAASKIIVEDYCSATKEQIIEKIKEKYGEKIVSIDYTMNKTDTSCKIDYKIIFACNETTTTTLPDGRKTETQVNSKVDRTKIEKTIEAGKNNFSVL